VTLYAGVDNITDAYQQDLAIGESRPAGTSTGGYKPLHVFGRDPLKDLNIKERVTWADSGWQLAPLSVFLTYIHFVLVK
jgi:hypothetical protein